VGRWVVVCYFITPLFELGEGVPARAEIRVEAGKGEEVESETVEVLRDVFPIRVAVVQLPLGRELGLNEPAEWTADFRGDDVSGFRVQVAAKPLKRSAEQRDVASQRFFGEQRKRWDP
jgi:hypothetical protein